MSLRSLRSRRLTWTQVLDDLYEIEAGMADHRGDARAAPQVGEAPERAEQAGRDRRVDALQEMSRAERDARHRQADGRPAEPHLEAAQEKRALNLFADPAGGQHHEREPPR